MSLVDALSPIFITITVILLAILALFPVISLLEWYRRRDNEFRRYGLQNLEHRFHIDAIDVEMTKQRIMYWMGSLKTNKIEERSPTHVRAHVNKWEFADSSIFYGWQKIVDVWIRQKGDGVDVTVKMTPSDGYQIRLIGEEVAIGWEKMTRQIMKSLDPGNISGITDINDGQYLKGVLNDHKRSYQRSLVLLVVFFVMIFFPVLAGYGIIQGAVNCIGVLGLIILIAKFGEEYQVYWDVHVKIEKEFGVQLD